MKLFADHGADVAARVARRMVVASHREGGQAQFAERPVGKVPSDGPIPGNDGRQPLDPCRRQFRR
ncbi:hypothetical protein [Streptomyces sp. NPDC048734]|uniref:hypothetical protein n=1 Tax=Streptomyces sp. NPDC048734 TaxID=3365590 RepID=UPI00371626C9